MYMNTPPHLFAIYVDSLIDKVQELSCRKQIARQLRTQYVEGIYRPN